MSLVASRLHEDDTVLELVLDAPPGNVLTMAMAAELGAALDAHRDREALRLVVIRGSGGRFSFGASVEEHRRDQAPRMLAGFHELIRKLAAYPVPTAALVEGPCLGGGFEVALVCQFLFADEKAKLGCPEIKLGVFPPVLATVGAHRLGSLVAERLTLTGETLDAETASRLGLLTAVFPAGEAAFEGVLAWYRENLRPLSAFALRQAAKASRQASGFFELLERGLEEAEGQYVAEVLPSHDGNEGIEAFLAKRPAEWRDR